MAAITSTETTVTKVWKHWWLDRLIGQTTNPNTPEQSFAITFVFVRGTKDEQTQLWELSTDKNDVRYVKCSDIFNLIATEAADGNTQPATVLEGLLTVAATIGKRNGILD
jgi:hypothetical protein